MFLRTILRSVNKSFSRSTNTMPTKKYNQRTRAAYYAKPEKRLSEQMETLSLLCSNKVIPEDWSLFKSDVLAKRGECNEKNINAIILKKLINSENLEVADSLARHLIKTNDEMSLGTINSIVRLYVFLGRQNKLTEDNANFITDTYKGLREKYQILDAETSEIFACALSTMGDMKNALILLDEVKITSVPSRFTYAIIIESLFNRNNKDEATQLILKSIKDVRNIHGDAYLAWVNYVIRNGKNAEDVLKGMEEILEFLSTNCMGILDDVALVINNVFAKNLKWRATQTKVSNKGTCSNCGTKLDLIPLTVEEFNLLQSKFKDQVLVGRDIFLKTSPEELKKFLDFLKETAPYDIVLDALNIFFAFNGSSQQKVDFLLTTVRYFLDRRKKILLLGREHITRWQKRDLDFLKKYTVCFFTDNMSQDDPFFLTAALYSGPRTDIMTRDKLRGHRHLLDEERLRNIFLRWQWEHQWRYSISPKGLPIIIRPLPFTPYAQKNTSWHVPYEMSSANIEDPMNALVTVPANWLCLQPPN